MQRVLIVGDAGRGKSTLAAKLSEKLNIPYHSTDDYYYEVKFSKQRDRGEAIRQISGLYEEDKWIVEGTTFWLLDPGIGFADTIVYLRYPSILIQWLVLFKRGLKRRDERLKDTLALMRHVLYKRYKLGYKKNDKTLVEFIEPHKYKVTILSSFREVNNFLNNI